MKLNNHQHIISNNNNRNKQNVNENEYFTFKEESIASSDKNNNNNNNETNIYNVNNNNYYCENKFYLEIPIDHKEQIFSCNRIETYSFRGGNYPNEDNNEHNKQQQMNNKSERISPNISWIKHMSTACKEDDNEIKQHTVDILNEPPLTAKPDLITQHSQLQIQNTNRSSNSNNNKMHSITASLSNQRAKIKKGSFHKFLHNQLFPIDFSKLRKHHLCSLNENNKKKSTVNNNNSNEVINKIKSISFKEIINNKPLYCKNYSIDKRCSSTGTMKYNKTINANTTSNNNKDNSFYSYHNINNNNSKHIKKNSNKIIDFQKTKRDLKINNIITTSSKGKYFSLGSALSSSSIKCFSPSLLNKHNNSSTLTKYKNIFNTSLHNLTNNTNNNSLHLNSSLNNNTNNTSGINNINYSNITSNKLITSNTKRSNLKSFYLFKKDNSMFNLIYPPNTNFSSNNTLYKSKHFINLNKYSYMKNNNFSSSNSLTSNRSSTRKPTSIGINTYRSNPK